MAFNLYKSLIQEGLLANRPTVPDQSDFRQTFYARDTGDYFMWSPVLAAWVLLSEAPGNSSNIAAAGATQGSATLITTRKVVVATATVSTRGVKLPVATTGMEVKIINNGPTFALKVWPNTNAKINAVASNSADTTTLAAFKTTVYQALDASHWVSFRGA